MDAQRTSRMLARSFEDEVEERLTEGGTTPAAKKNYIEMPLHLEAGNANDSKAFCFDIVLERPAGKDGDAEPSLDRLAYSIAASHDGLDVQVGDR